MEGFHILGYIGEWVSFRHKIIFKVAPYSCNMHHSRTLSAQQAQPSWLSWCLKVELSHISTSPYKSIFVYPSEDFPWWGKPINKCSQGSYINIWLILQRVAGLTYYHHSPKIPTIQQGTRCVKFVGYGWHFSECTMDRLICFWNSHYKLQNKISDQNLCVTRWERTSCTESRLASGS